MKEQIRQLHKDFSESLSIVAVRVVRKDFKLRTALAKLELEFMIFFQIRQ